MFRQTGAAMKEDVGELLEMVMTQGEVQQQENNAIHVLRCVAQVLFYGDETYSVESRAVFAEMKNQNIEENSEVWDRVRRIESGGRVSRVRLFDMIDGMEEVVSSE